MTEVSPCDNESISTVFLVSKKTGNFRPVINLKPLNQFVKKIHFKMDNIRMAWNCISPGDFMVSIDLKDAYFSAPVFQPHRKSLRFLGIPSVKSLLVHLLGTALHPGFSLRFLNLL